MAVVEANGVAAGTAETVAAVGGRMRSGVGAAAGVADGLGAPSFIEVRAMSSALALQATAVGGRVVDAPLASALAVAAALSSILLRDAEIPSALVLNGTALGASTLTATLASGLVVRASLPALVDAGEAWVVNKNNGASSRYEEFPFNSFGVLGGQYIGAMQGGLFALAGDDDDGVPIKASVSFGKTNMGAASRKRMVTTYAGISSAGNMFLKVTTEDNREYIYKARKSDEFLRSQRIDVGRGLEGEYFTFEIYNNDGCDFELASVEFQAADIMHRRI